MIFVDTNIFLYVIFDIDKNLHTRCIQFFEKAEKNNTPLWTTEWVIAEIIWFCLRNKKTPEEVKFIIHKICSSSYLTIRNRSYILQALELWSEKIGFIDAFNLLLCAEESVDTLYSFDKNLDEYFLVKRKEP